MTEQNHDLTGELNDAELEQVAGGVSSSMRVAKQPTKTATRSGAGLRTPVKSQTRVGGELRTAAKTPVRQTGDLRTASKTAEVRSGGELRTAAKTPVRISR